MPRFAAARVLAPFVLAVTLSCDSLTGKGDGSFTLGISESALSVNQGVTDTVLITITRKDFNKDITLNADGVPAGVSATLAPKTLTGNLNQSLLILASAGTATAGAATITVRAAAEGVAEQSATFALTVGITGSFTISAYDSPATTAAATGGGAQVTILVPRIGGHADNVSLTVSGAPTGVSAALSSAQTTGTGTTLNITSDGTAAVGAYTLKVKGTAPGNLADSVNVSVNVIAPPSTAALAVPFCSTFSPSWFAYRNEGYAWQTLAPAGATFTFQATAKVVIAYTFVVAGTNARTLLEVDHASRSELANQSDRDCQGPKTVNGSVSGATSGQTTRVSMGAALATATFSSPNFAIAGVADRVLDLGATKGTVTTSLSGLSTVTPDKVILQRGLNPANGGSVGTLDFATQSFTPATTSFTLANTGAGDLFNIGNTWVSPTGSYSVVHLFQPTATTNNLFSIPSGQLLAGELHEVLAESYQGNGSTGRLNIDYLGALTDRTLTFGPVMSTPTLTTLATTPYARLRGQLPVQAQYPVLTQFAWLKDGGNTAADQYVYLILSAAYLGGTPASTWDVALPDFTGLAGFNSSWVFSGAATDTEVDAFSGSIGILFGAAPILGDSYGLAYRYQSNQFVVRDGGRPALKRDSPRSPQYLRR